MAGYWPRSCVFVDRDEVVVQKHAKRRPISSHLDRTSFVNKGLISLEKNTIFLRDNVGSPKWTGYRHLARSGTQLQRRTWFILPAHGASHIIMLLSYPKRRLRFTEESVYLDKVLKAFYVFSCVELCPFFKGDIGSSGFCRIDVKLPHLKRVLAEYG